MSEANATDERTSRARTPRALWLLLVGALVLRLALIFAAPPDLFEKGEPNQEEMLRGIAAQEFVDGPVAPIFDYQVNHFWGGSLVTSILTAPVFLVSGPKLWALRLVGAGFAVAACWIAFRLLDRFAGRRAAWIGAAFLAFPPPGYAYSNCMVFGTHLESNTLALGLVWIWLEWRARVAPSVLRTALFGAAAGFALYFGYGLLLVLLIVAAFEFARDKGFVLRPWFGVFALGFLAGFSPWIAYAARQGFRGLAVYDAGIFEHFVEGITRGTALDLQGTIHASPLEKLGALLTRDLAEAQWFHGSLGLESLGVGHAFVLAMATLFLVALWHVRAEIGASLGACVSRVRRTESPSVAAFACAFVLAFVVVWTTSDFAIGPRGFIFNFRYLMPLWPFLAVAAAVGCAVLWERRGAARAVVRAAVVVLLATSIASSLARCRPDFVPTAARMPATSTKWFVRSLIVRFGEEPRRMVEIVESIERRRPPAVRDELSKWIGLGLRTLGGAPATTPRERTRTVLYRRSLLALHERAPPERRALFEPAPRPR